MSGSGASARVHILVKPTRADLRTNLVINTDRRTYHVELRATAATYMASVSWTYPQDQLIALQARNAAAANAAALSTRAKVSIRKRMERWRMAILKIRSQPGSYRDPGLSIERRARCQACGDGE